MQLTFSSAPANYREQLPSWAKAVYFEDFTRDEHTRCSLAHQHGELLGIISWWTARAHTSYYELQLAVTPSHRWKGLGTALYRHARAAASSPLPFFMRDYLGEPTLCFADSLGARALQLVPPSSMSTASAQKLRRHNSVVSAREVNCEVFEQAYVDFMSGRTPASPRSLATTAPF